MQSVAKTASVCIDVDGFTYQIRPLRHGHEWRIIPGLPCLDLDHTDRVIRITGATPDAQIGRAVRAIIDRVARIKLLSRADPASTVSLDEAARLSGLTRKTIRAARASGRLATVRVGRRVRVPIPNLAAIL